MKLVVAQGRSTTPEYMVWTVDPWQRISFTTDDPQNDAPVFEQIMSTYRVVTTTE